MPDTTPRHSDDDNTPLWKEFTVNGTTYNPNTWTIDRVGGVAAIMTGDGKLIDEPPDAGQDDGALIRHGILWTIADAACDDWSKR